MTATAACNRCASPLERGDLRCAVCGLPTEPAQTDDVEHVAARIFRCHGCGAALAYDESVGAPRCGFCRTVMDIETPVDPIEEAEAHLPFAVHADAAREALRRWLGSLGWFRPKDLRERAVMSEVQPLWWAGWVFDARVRVTWAADSDAGARRSAWAPHAGDRTLSLERVIVSASRGLTEAEIVALGGYRLDGAVAEPEPPRGAPGRAEVEQFAVQRSAARRTVAQALHRVSAGAVHRDVPGSSVRNLHVAVLPERLVTSRLAFPVWVFAYRYRDKLYRALVHGQDPERVIGDAPIAWDRVAMVVFAVLAAIAIGLAIALGLS